MASMSPVGQERLERASRGTGCALVFALPFCGFGILVLAISLQQVGAWWETSDWIEYPAMVRSAELGEHRDGDGGTTYSVDATYEYKVGERIYSGSRVWLQNSSDNVGDFHQRNYNTLQEHLTQNKPFRCYVDPSDASRSILFRDMRLGLLAFSSIFIVLFGGVGFAILYGLFRFRQQIRLAAERSEEFPNEPWKWETLLSEGRYPARLTWLSPVIGCCIGIVMGGVGVWVLLHQVLSQPLLAMMCIFPVVGVFTIYPAIRSIQRRLRDGAPTLIVAPWPLHVGDLAQLKCESDLLPPEGTTLQAILAVEQSPDSETTNVLATKDATASVTHDGVWTCELQLPSNVPATAGILDASPSRLAKWTVRITQPGEKWGFEASYEIRVFE